MMNCCTETESRTIDCIRPLLAFMVVGLHVRPYYADGTELFFNGWYDAAIIVIYRILFSVAVPAFFFISGFLFFSKLKDWDNSIWKDKIRKRIKTLLIPYIIWNLIAILGFIVTRFAGTLIKGNEPLDLITQLNERGWLRLFWDRRLFGSIIPDSINLFGISVPGGTPVNEPTWFIRDLMVVIAFSPMIWWFVKKGGKYFIAVIACFYIVDLWIPLTGFSSKAFFMFSLGAWFSLTSHNLIETASQHPRIQAILALILLFAASMSFGYNKWIYCITSRLFILVAILTVFHSVSEWIKRDRFYNTAYNLSKSSFFVFVAHTVLIVDALSWAFSLINRPGNPFVSFLLLSIETITVYVICHLIWLTLKRFTPRTLGVLTGKNH